MPHFIKNYIFQGSRKIDRPTRRSDAQKPHGKTWKQLFTRIILEGLREI